jgi:inhibitor of KinA sporulation pathway (predicted exonuclease)
MNHKAIFKIYPQVVTVDDGTGAFDKDGNKVEIDLALVNAWQDPDAYKYARAREFPPITDYIDGVVKGDQAQIDKYIADCLAVKAKYPKGVA